MTIGKFFESIRRDVDRKDFLSRSPPHCERCGTDQVQLMVHMTTPAHWRCRRCKLEFTHEPEVRLKGWNYRLVRRADGKGYGLHEVYYDGDGQAWAMSTEPASFACDADEGPEGVVASLRLALRDAEERSVFNEPEEGKWLGKAPGGDEDDMHS